MVLGLLVLLGLIHKTAFMTVSMNFALSGLFAYYSWAPILNATEGRISFRSYVCVRYLRTIPVIIAMMLIILAFPMYLGTGPVYRLTLNTITRNCIENGWAELLAVSNIFNVDKIVSFHSNKTKALS